MRGDQIMNTDGIPAATAERRRAARWRSGIFPRLSHWADRQQVIKDCSFALERGKLTVLIGPSGCGKTTLINLLADMKLPTQDDYRRWQPDQGPG